MMSNPLVYKAVKPPTVHPKSGVTQTTMCGVSHTTICGLSHTAFGVNGAWFHRVLVEMRFGSRWTVLCDCCKVCVRVWQFAKKDVSLQFKNVCLE